jgi:hypothetical protein
MNHAHFAADEEEENGLPHAAHPRILSFGVSLNALVIKRRLPCESCSAVSQSSDRPMAALLFDSPSSSALHAIFFKGFIGTAGMKRGTGHHFRDFHAKNPLIHGLRRCVFISVLVRWRPTRGFVPLR